MPMRIDFQDIIPGRATQTGHTVYSGAIYRPENKRIIYKLNKHNDSKFSRLEVAFNTLTDLFLQPMLTSPQTLVKDRNNQVLGVASDHLFYSASEREQDKSVFFHLRKRNNNLYFSKKIAHEPEDIPIYFFDQFESGLFPLLAEAEERGVISLDMQSLASILTTSYTLEEDDLHKGNLGFYLVEQDGKPHLVFQTIDPDMKMADSIMSFHDSRIFNWRHGQNAFKISARDLLNFPVLQDSSLWYWLTKKRFLTKPSDSKTYSSGEVRAFSATNQRDDFQQAKWRNFYKHILLPTELVKEALSAAYDPNDETDRAQIAMITQAVIERQARLRAVLLSMPDFRDFIKKMSVEEHNDLALEILSKVPENNQEIIRDKLSQTSNRYLALCEPDGIDERDTPLHVAIRLGEYSPLTWKSFREFAEQENGRGEKALDIAVQMAVDNPDWTEQRNIRANPACIVKHLIKKEVQKTPSYNRLSLKTKVLINHFDFPTRHMNDARQANTGEELIQVLRNVGEDLQFTLKMKKQLALNCVQQFINTHPKLNKSTLVELKQALNGEGTQQAPRPELQYIRQLRSRLWLIRKIRGLLGGTATQVELSRLLDQEIKRKPASGPGSLSLFHHQAEAEDADAANKCPPPRL